MTNNDSDIFIREDTKIGRMTFQRPGVLNALSHKMSVSINEALLRWATEPQVDFILIDADGCRAFCAGGDVQDLYNQGKAGDFTSGALFWRDEYHMNALIKNYSKPIITVMDGITMGGGVGVACHASHRMATENTVLALPECSIGLIPDVGSTHLLATAPGHLGEFLALTGQRLSGVEAVYCGFADYYMPSGFVDELVEKLRTDGDISAINQFADLPVASEIEQREPEISKIFALDDLNEIVTKLREHTADWAAKAYRKIAQSSPLSCKVAFALVRQSRENPGIKNALEAEFRFVSRAMEQGDFLEGVRANIIDKDRTPKWLHRSIADVPDELVTLMTSEAAGGDITFSSEGGN